MKKKVILLCTAAVMIAVLAVGGTLAYLTATTGPAENTFAIGRITSALNENGDPYGEDEKGTYVDWPTIGEDNPVIIEPGQYVQKAPKINITAGSSNAYVRIRIEGDLDCYEVYHWVDGEDEEAGSLESGYNITSWTWDGTTEAWYYNFVLSPEGTTEPLFDSIRLKTDATYVDNITVYGELIQADNIDDDSINSKGQDGAIYAIAAFSNWPSSPDE
jgi:predicted ribosomally synthesized peptide with SipW-like signal peptide